MMQFFSLKQKHKILIHDKVLQFKSLTFFLHLIVFWTELLTSLFQISLANEIRRPFEITFNVFYFINNIVWHQYWTPTSPKKTKSVVGKWVTCTSSFSMLFFFFCLAWRWSTVLFSENLSCPKYYTLSLWSLKDLRWFGHLRYWCG